MGFFFVWFGFCSVSIQSGIPALLKLIQWTEIFFSLNLSIFIYVSPNRKSPTKSALSHLIFFPWITLAIPQASLHSCFRDVSSFMLEAEGSTHDPFGLFSWIFLELLPLELWYLYISSYWIAFFLLLHIVCILAMLHISIQPLWKFFLSSSPIELLLWASIEELLFLCASYKPHGCKYASLVQNTVRTCLFCYWNCMRALGTKRIN